MLHGIPFIVPLSVRAPELEVNGQTGVASIVGIDCVLYLESEWRGRISCVSAC